MLFWGNVSFKAISNGGTSDDRRLKKSVKGYNLHTVAVSKGVKVKFFRHFYPSLA